MKHKSRIASLFRGRSGLTLLLIGFVFVFAIALLFVQERQKMDAEFETMVSATLSSHTQRHAAQLEQALSGAQRALQAAEAMLSRSDLEDDIRERLEQRNEGAPDYPARYLSPEELAEGVLNTGGADVRAQLARGEAAVTVGYDDALAQYCLWVLVPLSADSDAGGVLYTPLGVDELFQDDLGGVVYQGVQTCLTTADGYVLYNTYQPEHQGSLFDGLGYYNLSQEEIDRISAMVTRQETGGTTFLRKGQSYFVSSSYIAQGDWRVVSVVRGPDVILRSSNLFRNVVRSSATAILITAAAACVIFLQLLSSRRMLEEEQKRSQAFARWSEAMFKQHGALMLVTDAHTREILNVNPAMLDYLGYTREEMLGHYTPEFTLLSSEIVAEKVAAGSMRDLLFSAAPYRLKNGEMRLLDVYASLITEGGRKMLYSILFDVTDKDRYWKELLREKELLSTTLKSIGDGVVTTDTDGCITSMNAVAQKLTGWEGDSALGRPFAEVFPLQNEETGLTVEGPIQKVLQTGRVVGLANHTELKTRQSTLLPIADSAAPIKTEDGYTFGVIMVFRDVSGEREHNRQVEYLSYHDSLTGLFNRRYIEEAMTRLDEEDCLPVSVIMADVNGLKITNDVFGHKAGDSLLKSVASLLGETRPQNALLARWGGDEFVILMPGSGLEAAEVLIRDIKAAHVEIEASSLYLSLSLGCACKDAPSPGIQFALTSAEENMYQQKLLDGKSYRSAVISTLLATLYEKSNETEEHSKRLETYCHAIGRELQLSSREMDELSLLALLHDIGKVGIHPNILQKPGALTPEEWVEMRRHPEIGYRIAQATPELAAMAELILSHHERWDGRGYPRRLKGVEIPLACRILSVVDAYDAMTNDRVYRPAMSIREAAQEIRRNTGTQFDPRMAQILIGIVTDRAVEVLV